MVDFRLPGGDVFSGKSPPALEAEFYRQRKEQLPKTQNWFLSAGGAITSGTANIPSFLRWFVQPLFVYEQLKLVGATVQVTTLSAANYARAGIYRYTEKGARFDLVPGTAVQFPTDATGTVRVALTKSVEILPSRQPYFLVSGTSDNVAAYACQNSYQALTDLWLVKTAAEQLPTTFNKPLLSSGAGRTPIIVVYFTMEASRIY